MEIQALKPIAIELLAQRGVQTDSLQFSTLSGGANNQVFLLESGAERWVAKVYFKSEKDPRDRFGAEYAFFQYAWKAGIRDLPEPIAGSAESGVALYEWISGRKLNPGEVTRGRALEAAGLVQGLNSVPERDSRLNTASESVFSVQGHLDLIEGRLKRLEGLSGSSDAFQGLRVFLKTMRKAWGKISGQILETATHPSLVLTEEDRCISPSDFGMHNALLRDSGPRAGRLCFIDFEYAGWDDPAKLVGDFFCQPAVPVPLEHLEAFMKDALSYSQNQAALMDRARLLLPVYVIKWCCIMLNEFSPDAANRRRFANPGLDLESSRRAQLEKAERFFNLRADPAWLT